MNKLVPFKKFSKKSSQLDAVTVVVDDKNIPLEFRFGRDALISFLEYLDLEFEQNINDPDIAYNNPAGKLIDLIEEKLPVRTEFAKDLKESIKNNKNSKTFSLDEISRSLNV